MEKVTEVEKIVEDEFNKDVDLVKDATGMDTWWDIWQGSTKVGFREAIQ